MTSDNSPYRSLVKANAADAVPAALGPELEEAAGYARAEKAQATRQAYRSDFGLFRSWCEMRHVSALPATPQTVAAFLAAEANRGSKPSTIGRRLAAIRYAHKLASHEPPTNSEVVKATLRGIRRTANNAPARKTPATADRIVAMVNKTGSDPKGLRDRALLLLGFAGALRRSELVALNVEDLQFCEGGLRVTIRKSKTDQEGVGATIGIVSGSSPALLMQYALGSRLDVWSRVHCSDQSPGKERFRSVAFPLELFLSLLRSMRDAPASMRRSLVGTPCAPVF